MIYQELFNNLFTIVDDKKEYEKLQKEINMQIEYYNDNYDSDGNPITGDKDWKHVALDISKIHAKKFSDVNDIPFGNVKDFVFAETADEGYLCAYAELNFFQYKYHKINGFYPYIYRFEQFKINSFVSNLFKHCEVPEFAYVKNTYQGDEEAIITSLLICFSKTLYLYVDGENKGAIYYDPQSEKDGESFLYTLLGLLKGVKTPKVTKNKIYIVYKNQYGFEKMGFDVKKIKIDLQDNYNEGFEQTADNIIDGLNDKNKTNLVILSGEPGTGKTSFIRYLTSKLKKNIIFISPDMVDSITDPAFIPFLMKNNDSVLIIEDAEPALEKRDNGGRSSAVSNVLNLTDGLLSDCLKISIVATFNTKEGNIDEALTRKGRLLMSYKFDKLAAVKATALLKKLGHEIEVKEPMTLADIYFYGTDNNVKHIKTKKIGF